MDIFFPKYYHSFRCIAENCPDSCCKEWAVDVDSASAEYYRSLPGSLGDRLRAVLQDTDDGTVMTIENNCCPMWRWDGLCEIQAQLGHDALCKTCRDFPRLHHDYGDFMELGLELSCPEAARLILTSKDHAFICRQQSGGEPPEYDPEVMGILRSSRTEMLSFLETSPYSLPETLAIILLHSHSIQTQLDGGAATPFVPERCLADAKKYTTIGDISSIFAFFLDLEILTNEWKMQLMRPPVTIQWPNTLYSFVCYGIQRWWLQSISDFDLVCRVKMIITACLLIGSLGEDPIKSAQLYSKEIENNLDNVESILDAAYNNAALTDVNLLSLLLP